MVINTHLLFSKLIFNHCLKELDFKLSKGIFMYGNIKPDIFSENTNNSHTLEDSTIAVQGYINKLLNNDLTIHEFSLNLGILCHYTCDFFCIYHRKEFTKVNIFKHLIYEIQLHFKLIILLVTGKLKPLKNKGFPQKDILSIILEMQLKYLKEKNSIIKDITYALSTAILISESALQFSSIKTQCSKLNTTNTGIDSTTLKTTNLSSNISTIKIITGVVLFALAIISIFSLLNLDKNKFNVSSMGKFKG